MYIKYGTQALTGQIFSPTYLCQNYEAAFYINPVANVSSYDWSVSGYGAVLVSGQGSSQIMAKSIYTTPVTVSVSAVNACGPSSSISKTVETRYCENDWLVAPDPNPNPATNYRVANTGNPIQLALAPDEIKVYNENGKIIDNLKGNNVSDIFKKQFLIEGRKAELNVKDLPGGIYYFHLMKNGKVIDKVRVALK